MGEALPCSAHTGRVCIPPTRKQALKRLENATGSTRISIFLVSVPKRLVSRRVGGAGGGPYIPIMRHNGTEPSLLDESNTKHNFRESWRLSSLSLEEA